MAAKIHKVKVKGDTSLGKIKQLSLALGVAEEEVVQQAVELFWLNNTDRVREFLASIDTGTALFAKTGENAGNGHNIGS